MNLVATALLIAATSALQQTPPEAADPAAPTTPPQSSEPTPTPPEQPPEVTPPAEAPAENLGEKPYPPGLGIPNAQPSVKLEPPGDPLPHMKWDEPVLCAYLVPTKNVPSGEFRLQCDEQKRLCLVSPARELDSDDVESQEMLTRTQPCQYSSVDWQYRAERGWRFVPAVAEAPPGWYRDDRGRVMQFNFDLNRRVYLGGAWSPAFNGGESGFRNRYRADFGVELEFPDDARETLFRIHMLEGEFFLAPDGENIASLNVFRYEWSHQRGRPLARISTFIGTPARFDLKLNLGGYLEALTLDTVRRPGVSETQLMLGTAQPTFDLWHSKDLVSYLRLRAGPGLALDTGREAVLVMGQAAVEGDFTLDPDGFHHARVSAEAERSFFGPVVEGRPRDPLKFRVKAEYEVVFIAINDQPLSLVLDGRGTWRDDLPNQPVGWEWSAGAGLRFSLWAPARRSAPFLDRI